MVNPNLLKTEIPVERVRWFYGRGSAHANTWKAFRGADSINIEREFRELRRTSGVDREGKVVVRDGLFEADLRRNVCSPIFWPGEKRSQHSHKKDWCTTPIQRGLWFNKINWIPLDFTLASFIEQEHINVVIPKLSQLENSKKTKRTIHKMSHDGHSISWTSHGDIYLVTKSAQPFAHVKLQGDLSSVPIERGFHVLADPNDCKPPVTQLCFVVHGIGQQLASIRHECAKIRKLCLKVVKKRYPKLTSSGQRIEFIPVDWRSPLNLNFSTLENITIGQMRPLRMYINNCFVDVLYYTSSVYRVEIMRSLSWELMRLFNLFLKHNPHFLQKGGQVSVLAHSLGTVIMHDILRNNNVPIRLVDPESPNNRQQNDEQSEAVKEIIDEIDQKRFELVDLELKVLRQTSTRSGNSDTHNTFLSNIQRPASWKPLPQLSHLFLIGSPLGLFISLNAIPSTYQPLDSPKSPCPQSTPQSTHRHGRRRSARSQQMSSPQPDGEVLELNERDPDVLIPYSSCRRLYNIYHSYDPIAYRLEPLLLKHYSTVAPVVLQSPMAFLGKRRSSRSSNPTIHRLGSSIDLTLTAESGSSRVRLDKIQTVYGSVGDGCLEEADCLAPLTESDTGSSDNESTQSVDDQPKNLFKRISVNDNQIYRQHKSKTVQFFSRYVTRRSSHVTSLGPALQMQRSEPEAEERRLRYRVDYEWQKSFSPLAVLGAHYSYWSSEELAFFILYQIFGHPDSIS